MNRLGMHRIWNFEILPEPDFAGFEVKSGRILRSDLPDFAIFQKSQKCGVK